MPKRWTGGLPRVGGIYAIRNTRSGAMYIGSTRNLRQRWATHRSSLKAGRHPVRALQNAWREEGPDAFSWELLEEMPLPVPTRALAASEGMWHDRMRAMGAMVFSRWVSPRADADEPTEELDPVTIRFPRSLRKRALAVAQNEDRTYASLVIYALRRYVTERERESGAHGDD